MQPHHYTWATFFQLIHDWYNGITDKNDTLFSIKFFWLNRFGSILQFIAGLSIILEIIGRDKVNRHIRNIEKFYSFGNTKREFKQLFFLDSPRYNRWGKIIFFVLLIHLILLGFTETSHWSDVAFAVIIIAILVSAFWVKPIRLIRNIGLFPLFVIISLYKFVFQLFFEMFLFKPVILYLSLSRNDKKIKAFSFFILFFGFIICFLFS